MKKLFAVTLALMMLLSAAATAESADFLGDWYLTGIESEGTIYYPSDFGMSVSMTLNDDGTAHIEFHQGDQSEPREGTWVLEGDAAIVTVDDEPQTFVLADGTLVSEGDSGMIFGREPVEIEGYTPAAVVEAEEADFFGSWTTFTYGTDGVFMNAAATGMDMVADISEGSLLLTGILGSETPYSISFADNAYCYDITDENGETVTIIKAEMLEDGNLQLTRLFFGTEYVLIMAPTEAAE